MTVCQLYIEDKKSFHEKIQVFFISEVTFLVFLYQALVFDRKIVHVAFIDGAVLIIASMTIIETYVSMNFYLHSKVFLFCESSKEAKSFSHRMREFYTWTYQLHVFKVDETTILSSNFLLPKCSKISAELENPCSILTK